MSENFQLPKWVDLVAILGTVAVERKLIREDLDWDANQLSLAMNQAEKHGYAIVKTGRCLRLTKASLKRAHEKIGADYALVTNGDWVLIEDAAKELGYKQNTIRERVRTRSIKGKCIFGRSWMPKTEVGRLKK